jgi:hypothetical protein
MWNEYEAEVQRRIKEWRRYLEDNNLPTAPLERLVRNRFSIVHHERPKWTIWKPPNEGNRSKKIGRYAFPSNGNLCYRIIDIGIHITTEGYSP